MTDRLAAAMEDIVARVEPVLRRHAEQQLKSLGDLVDVAALGDEPGLRLDADIAWSPVAGVAGFHEGRARPLHRVDVTRAVTLADRDEWRADATVRMWAEASASRLTRGIAALLWTAATPAPWPASPSDLRGQLAQLGGMAVLVVRSGQAVPDDLKDLLDGLKEVPAGILPGKGYLRSAAAGPVVEMLDWQVGWDRTPDVATANLVAERTLRVRRQSHAIRLGP